jgi:hypothetical protein
MRKPTQRAFAGRLVGMPSEPDDAPAVAVLEPPPERPPDPPLGQPPKKQRGRPLQGAAKKTHAEIKRAQRAKEKEELESVRLLQEQQRIYVEARRRFQRELDDAISCDDDARARELRDLLISQEEQREYDAQLSRAGKRGPTSGRYIADAPQGKGLLVYGGDNIVALGDQSAEVDEDGNAVFDLSRKVTRDDEAGDGNMPDIDTVKIKSEKEDKFHGKHPIKWRRSRRNLFDRREQEEKILQKADEYLQTATVAIFIWDGETFAIIRQADEEVRCTLCGRAFLTDRMARNHLVENHARQIAPMQRTRAKTTRRRVN